VSTALRILPTLEMGSLSVAAEVQDPDVRWEPDAPGVLRLVEGAVDVSLCFPDRAAVVRFCRRVGALRVPPASRS
jgi:hypothetical protein